MHVVAFLAFLAILPITKLRHMFTSPMNMYLKDRDRPKGAMKPMPNLMETELETFGAVKIEDFTWKQLFDTDACTVCGRCTSVCPAHATGKPLDPREIVLKVGEVMAATGSPVVSPPVGVDGDIHGRRRQRVRAHLVRGDLGVHELQGVRRDLPGQHRDPRQDPRHAPLPHADGERLPDRARQHVPVDGELRQRVRPEPGRPRRLGEQLEGVDIVEAGAPFDHEYLYFVGCAGSFDDRNKKTSRALAKLLQRAGIDFAILGPSELCNGDQARRSGNEYIFQMLAMQNVETFNAMGVKKIITQCPHCFNVMKNDYPQLGGNYEVIHHWQLLDELVRDGRLSLAGASLEERVTYHDSCYLGRHNDVYLAPRRVVGSLAGIDLVEMPRNGTKGMCCGAGGARMWMEENTGKKVNTERSQEAIATGATRIAVACPFCYVMFDDGVKGEGKDEEVRVQDIAEILWEAIEAEAARRASRDCDVPRPASSPSNVADDADVAELSRCTSVVGLGRALSQRDRQRARSWCACSARVGTPTSRRPGPTPCTRSRATSRSPARARSGRASTSRSGRSVTRFSSGCSGAARSRPWSCRRRCTARS